MRKIVISMLAAIVLAACGNSNKQQEKDLASQSTIDSLTDVVNQKNNELNDIMSTFNDIQEGFREINEAEGRVNISRNSGETNAKNDIMENISFIKRTMQLNKERIAKLKEQLKESSFNTSKLQATIENLNKELESKNSQIEKLQAELDSKNAHIATQDKQISELNTNVNSLPQKMSRRPVPWNARTNNSTPPGTCLEPKRNFMSSTYSKVQTRCLKETISTKTISPKSTFALTR